MLAVALKILKRRYNKELFKSILHKLIWEDKINGG